MPRGKGKSGNSSNGATLGFERELWKAADTLRGSMDAAEYKHVVLGLIFLKYISDAFEEQEDGSELFEEKMARLMAELRKQHMEAAIAANLKELGYGQ
jgi:type I restriction-modification system DNA methylase subunit